MNGWLVKVLWVNLAEGSIKEDTLDPQVAKDYIGGRGLGIYFLNKYVDPACDALSPENLLVMATGTGKTYVAFQIIWRLWKARAKKRILFLVDRNILADQTKTNDFKPFGNAMTKIKKRQVDKSYEVYLSLFIERSKHYRPKSSWKFFH